MGVIVTVKVACPEKEGVTTLKKSKSERGLTLPDAAACPLELSVKGSACARVLFGSNSAEAERINAVFTTNSNPSSGIEVFVFTVIAGG